MPPRKRDNFPPLRTEPVPWNPGEHVAIIGTTGTGKSYLMSQFVQLRKYVAIFQTKRDDIKYKGFKRVPNHRALEKVKVTDASARFIVAPAYDDMQRAGLNLFAHVYQDGGWTLVVDESYFAHAILKLERPINMLMTQGRSKGISMVNGMQRPVHVSRFVLSECTHIFAFRLEQRDAKTIGDVAGDHFADVSLRIPRFHFAHYHVPTRSVAVGTADLLDRVIAAPGKPG